MTRAKGWTVRRKQPHKDLGKKLFREWDQQVKTLARNRLGRGARQKITWLEKSGPGEIRGEEMGAAGQGQIWWGCQSHGKEIGFYSNCHGNSLEDVEQGRNMISFELSPEHPGFSVKNRPQTRMKQEES